MTEIRLGIIDRRAVFCASLRAFFESQPDFRVLWAVTSQQEAVQQDAQATPDAIVIDCDSGDECLTEDMISRLTDHPGAARIIMLVDHVTSGADAAANCPAIVVTFLKTDPPKAILSGIRAAVGSSAMTLRRNAMDLRIDPTGPSEIGGHSGRQHRLTNRQIEIITHLADGASSKEIARRLHLSVKSVSSHSYRIMKRLNLHDRVALVRYAIREGLVSP